MDWENIYRRYSSGVFQYLLSMTHGSQEAEDLLQETFIKAMHNQSSLRDTGKMRSWLLTIARNLFFDSQRKNKRSGRNFDYQGINVQELENIPDPGNNPEKQMVQTDFKSRLKEVLAELSETYHTAFVLGIIQRLSYREIEEITSWSPAMVKTNIFRARKKVASALSEFQR